MIVFLGSTAVKSLQSFSTKCVRDEQYIDVSNTDTATLLYTNSTFSFLPTALLSVALA